MTKLDSSRDAPVILFDGVCNLCSAAVKFVIDRDGGQFRFAALQSDAARAALDSAGWKNQLPDSMVVIDDRGVHIHSNAVIAIARRLCLPWRLLILIALLPRFVRDSLYRWIARHRYSWSGRQNACRIPTPELRARFLDRDELPRILPPEDVQAVTASGGKRRLGLGTLPGRFLLLYPIIFILPFPLTLLRLFDHLPGFADTFLASGRDWVIGLHAQATQPIIGWLGRLLTGKTPSFEFTGSGDGLASYLGVLLDIGIAVGLSLLWWVWRRSTPISPRMADIAHVLLRYFLAWVMLSYGLSKVFPLQFPVMGPDRLLHSYGDSSPMGLAWTFMGASPGYQMFAGAAEVVGALLLLFRRTSLLGALIITGVMTNVFAMNMSFDIPVKLYSFHYLMLAVLVALPDLPRLVGLFVANVPVAARDIRPFWFASRQWRWTLGVAKIALMLAIIGTGIDSRVEQMRTRGSWAPANPLKGLYRVQSFVFLDIEPNTNTPPDSLRWLRVGLNPPGSATVQFADGKTVRLRMRLDEEHSTLALFDRSFLEPPSDPLQYELINDDSIRITGLFENRPIEVMLRRDESEALFTTRGFRWINEIPFNR